MVEFCFKHGDFILFAGVLGLLSLSHLAHGTTNSSVLSSQPTMALNSTPVSITSSMSPLTSSSISRDVYTNSSRYISPTPSLRQYSTTVEKSSSANKTSSLRTPTSSTRSFQHILPLSVLSTKHVNSGHSNSLLTASRSHSSHSVISVSTVRVHIQSSSTAMLLSSDIPVPISSLSPPKVNNLSLYSGISYQYATSTIISNHHVPLSPTTSSATSTFGILTAASLTILTTSVQTHFTSIPGTFATTSITVNGSSQTSIKPTVSTTGGIVSHTPSIHLVKPSMVIKPPPLLPVTKPTGASSLHGCKIGSCCTYGLSQLPVQLSFEESEPRGYVLAVIRDVKNVNFTVRVARPLELANILKDNFAIVTTITGYNLVLSKEIDLEDLYDKTDGKVDVHTLQMQISCTENSSIIVPPRMLNVSVDDVDDNMPVFRQPGIDSKDCVIPVYKADTSEDYTGELALNPGKIEAVDGDVSFRHNISYKVMHSEPADYHLYFSLDTENGTVHKTKTMNSSDPNKYIIFVQAVEDSPQQKSRVAVLLVVVVAPSDPFSDQHKASPTARLALKIACAFILMAFICGVVVIVHHRYTLSRAKVESRDGNELRDMKLPKLAVYQSSNSSLNSAIPEIPVINSPSQIVVASCENTLKPEKWDNENRRSSIERRESESQRKRRLIVKKPIDTKSRPSWNAPSPKPKRTRYNPFSVYQTQHNSH